MHKCCRDEYMHMMHCIPLAQWMRNMFWRWGSELLWSRRFYSDWHCITVARLAVYMKTSFVIRGYRNDNLIEFFWLVLYWNFGNGRVQKYLDALCSCVNSCRLYFGSCVPAVVIVCVHVCCSAICCIGQGGLCTAGGTVTAMCRDGRGGLAGGHAGREEKIK